MGTALHTAGPSAANPFPLATWLNGEQNVTETPHEELK